jgi:hypothetical protein
MTVNATKTSVLHGGQIMQRVGIHGAKAFPPEADDTVIGGRVQREGISSAWRAELRWKAKKKAKLVQEGVIRD